MTEHHYGTSGGRIEHLREGWARIPFRGRLAHWWVEDELDPPIVAEGGRVRAYTSTCGIEAHTSPRVPALGVGDLGWCKRCAKRHRAPNAQEKRNLGDFLRDRA